MKTVFLLLSIFALVSCHAPAEKPAAPGPETMATGINKTFMSLSDLNDCYLTLSSDWKFEYYKMLFDSIKNTEYTGTYQLQNDTILLNFDKKEGEALLGNRLLMDETKEHIVFIDAAPEARYMHLFN